MDTGEGRFRKVEEAELPTIEKDPLQNQYLFKVGEVLEIKGSRFQVQSIKPKKLILKLLRRNKP